MNWLQRHTTTSSSKASRTTSLKSGTDRDKKLEIHVGRNSRIMKSILGSKDYHEQHSHLYVGTSRFFLSQERPDHDLRERAPQFCCERRVVVKYVESVCDFWNDTCAGKCPECRKQSSETFQIHYDCVRAACSRLAPATDSVTEHWKRPRRESLGRSREGSKSLRSMSITTTPAE